MLIKTPQGIPYDELFDTLLRKALPANFHFKRFSNTNLRVLSSNEGKHVFFFGLDLGLNASSVKTLVQDKYLTWLLLNEKEETRIYSMPLNMKFFISYGRELIGHRRMLTRDLYDHIEKEKKLVLKPVNGMGGFKVFKVENKMQIDRALKTLGLETAFIATNFINIKEEYRIFAYRPEDELEVLFCIKKTPMRIKGDGKKKIKELIFYKFSQSREGIDYEGTWKDVEEILAARNFCLDDILPEGTEINVTWRLNQVLGSETTVIERNNIPDKVLDIARNVFQILNMNFGCVDVAKCEKIERDAIDYVIVEANTAVLSDLFDFYSQEELIQVLKKSINHLLKRHVNTETILDNIKNTQKEDKKETKQIVTTYEEKASLKKQCINEACKSMQVSAKFYSHDYLSVIDDKIFMIAFDLGIENTTAVSICQNKDVTSQVLKYANVPSVEHKLFKMPEDQNANEGNYGLLDEIFQQAKEWNMNVIVKKRVGSGGMGVFRIQDEIELEKLSLIEMERGIVMSPYLDIKNEYRILTLNGEPLCIYKKNKLNLVGDGKSSFLELIIMNIKDKGLRNRVLSDFLDKQKESLDYVLKKGEKYSVTWKHNLDQGSIPEISEDAEINTQLLDLALRSTRAIGMTYAAVDIIETGDDGKLYVLEVNSTPTYYHFIAKNAQILNFGTLSTIQIGHLHQHKKLSQSASIDVKNCTS
ncbi:10320_t:CDS:2 [Ambispora gerdemannii]|uniref:10320_t:CDS:1 n=1 Tax=Ambispora gerdemannii TaxID=144530 RepID=A0A9N9A5F0_9GLOM|nr:10320_t:CDS:2 [Ambispora gerdemannii]